MTEPDDEPVRTRLARLSAALLVDPPPDELVAAVDTRIAMLPVPAPPSGLRLRVTRMADRLRRHWRAATAIAVALLLVLLAVSPAGARIARWLGIGTVLVEQEQMPTTGPPDPSSADGFTEVTLTQARARAAFPLVVPGDLGPPTKVLIGPDDTVVSMVWAGGDPVAPVGPIRLDQIAGQPDFAVIKRYAQDIEFTAVNGKDAFWLRVPHPLDYVDRTGATRTERSRIAGPTLIWLDGPVTLRLEGVGTQTRALQIARSHG